MQLSDLSTGGKIVIGAVILLILIGLVFVFNIPQIIFPATDSNLPIVNPIDSNNQVIVNPIDTNMPAAVLCKPLDVNTHKLLAIVSDTNTAKRISIKGPRAPFFLLYRDMNFRGRLYNIEQANIDANKLISLSAIATQLSDRNVDAVVLPNPTKAFVDALKKEKITCYTARGIVAVAIGKRIPVDKNESVLPVVN
ncbi:MAG: hypothetical protein WC821_00560 [archaeon]